MGAELGATTSVFPSDEITREFLKAQGREKDWVEILPDEDAVYDEEIVIDLSELKPLAAMPHMPDKVKAVSEIVPLRLTRYASVHAQTPLLDMLKVAAI